MVAKPASWIKKHWVKVLVAIIVVYVIYWLFFADDMEGYTTTRVHTADEIKQLKNDYEDAKDEYEKSVREYNDVLATTYQNRNGVVDSTGAATCSKDSETSTDKNKKYFTTLGCKGYMLEKKALMDAALAEYKPYMKKQRKRRSLNSRVRRFFGMRG